MKNDSYKLTKAQALAGFLEEERAEELDIITAAMTKEQHVAALEAGGMSRAAQDAYFEKQNQKLREMLAKLPAPENVVPIRKDVAAAPPAPKRPLLTRRDAKVGGAFGSLAAAATFIICQAMTAAPAVAPLVMTAASGARMSAAETIRADAYQACGRGHFQECLDALDRAKALDPDGDELTDAHNARKLALQGLHR